MSASTTRPTTGSDAIVRQPKPEELARVAHLFRNTRLRLPAKFLVAVKSRPIERFLGAVAWGAEGPAGRFQLVCQPGVTQSEVAALLVESFIATARSAALTEVQYADLLSESDPLVSFLRKQGFECMRSERSFQVSYRDAWTRVMRLHKRHASEIPATWRTDPIRSYAPEVILDLIAPHRLLPLEELRQYWQGNAATGFDPELSCILFDQARPFGTFLVRRAADIIYIDVQVVAEPNPRLRSLADLCLLYHDAKRVAPDGPIRWIQFRSGQAEHRQTANLALRMGGQELPRMHVLGRKLTS